MLRLSVSSLLISYCKRNADFHGIKLSRAKSPLERFLKLATSHFVCLLPKGAPSGMPLNSATPLQTEREIIRSDGSSPSLPRVINFKFPLQPHQKYNTTQYGEIAFHSLLDQMKGAYTATSHYLGYTSLCKRLRECTFWTWEWKGFKTLAQSLFRVTFPITGSITGGGVWGRGEAETPPRDRKKGAEGGGEGDGGQNFR